MCLPHLSLKWAILRREQSKSSRCLRAYLCIEIAPLSGSNKVNLYKSYCELFLRKIILDLELFVSIKWSKKQQMFTTYVLIFIYKLLRWVAATKLLYIPPKSRVGQFSWNRIWYLGWFGLAWQFRIHEFLVLWITVLSRIYFLKLQFCVSPNWMLIVVLIQVC